MELGQFDEKENKYREASTGMLHTRERCEAMKNTMRNNSKPATEEPQRPPTEIKAVDAGRGRRQAEAGREDTVQRGKLSDRKLVHHIFGGNLQSAAIYVQTIHKYASRACINSIYQRKRVENLRNEFGALGL